ncbi:MAG: hypothetical protein H0X50_11550 [Nitrosopumilus sp.]|nr:hypothetical protein [Nitrosopumilus sp.]
MDSNNHDKSTRTPTLQAAIVEPILVCCINDLFNEIEYEIQIILPLSSNKLTKYSLYLIDYQIIAYNGHKQVYAIEIGGYDLLDMTIKEKG